LDGAEIGSLIQTASTWVLPILLAITFHEASHGFVAWRLGDDTAYRLGRVTFNPFRHIDPIGTIALPGLLILIGGPPFGYAKPVPVNFGRLRHPRRDSALVAAAGPGSNIVLALLSGLAFHTVPWLPESAQFWAASTLLNSIILNVILAIFNMLPMLPLDGGRVLATLLPRELAIPFMRTERFGMAILLALIFIVPMIGNQFDANLNILGWLLHTPYEYVVGKILALTGANAVLSN
jgi:Zn-dependent protease